MSAPKKAAKKTPAKSAPKHDKAKDQRRAYEHGGRVAALRTAVGEKTHDIDALVELAENELAGSHFKDAADLLRAAEHLSFAYLASSKSDKKAHEDVLGSVEEEYDHKLEKAEEHWEESEHLSSIYQSAIEQADQALQKGAHLRALEFVRAAEAIAHVHLHENS